MSHLLAIAYPEFETAQLAADAFVQLQDEHALVLEDLVLTQRAADGSVRLVDPPRPLNADAAWGGLIDAALIDRLTPAGGAAVLALVERADMERVVPRITPFGGERLEAALTA